MSRSYMAGNFPTDNEGRWPAPPESTEGGNVHYLFSVRNMFFFDQRYWPVLTLSGLFWFHECGLFRPVPAVGALWFYAS